VRDAPFMDRATVAVYADNTNARTARGQRPVPESLAAFAARTPPGIRAHLGSGPGSHSGPGGRCVQADLERLPFRCGALQAAWADKSYLHVAAAWMPMALAELHRAVALGGAVHLQVPCDQLPAAGDDPFRGRLFTHFTTAEFRTIVEAAGFEVLSSADDGAEWAEIEATRARLLPDTVGPDMRVLVVGLNPSVYSADAGVGFARPGNRFWPAAIASGLVARRLDTFAAVRDDGVGMTNIVRRPTPRADALAADEYRAGRQRLTDLVTWLRPRAVCFVGITGYRIAWDRDAVLGWQPEAIGDAPVYVMPNTSGLNAHAKPADFVEHFRVVQQPPD
jgi:TDG/mug DNA glycosylase family protein